MSGALGYSVMCLAWIAALDAFRVWRRRAHDMALRANCITLMCVALVLTLLLPPVYQAVDDLSGVPNLTRLLANSVGVIGAWAFQPFVAQTLGQRRPRSGIIASTWFMILTIGVLVVLFVLAPVDQTEPRSFTSRFAAAPFVLEYTLVFMCYLGLICLRLCYLNLRYLRTIPELRIRIGIQAFAWGLATVYTIHESLVATLRRIEVPYLDLDPSTVSNVLLVGSVMCNVTSKFVDDTLTWWGKRRAYRELYRLWRVLYESTPEVALYPPRSLLGDALVVRDLDFQLHRRAIEIRDGMAALGPFRDAVVVERARRRCREAGLMREDAQAVVEAVCLRIAIAAKVSARYPAQPAAPPTILDDSHGVDLAKEIAYLRKVARAYRHSPILREMVADEGWERWAVAQEVAGENRT